MPEGFELVAGRVTAADGEVCDVCLWLAATAEQRGRGLMGVTDLGDGDGMVFRWDEATNGNFWMRDTPQPLSIAFYAADGSFVSATDMEPCLQPIPDAECPRYAAGGAYTYAVEVFAGGLPALLMGPGSRLDLLEGGCPGRRLSRAVTPPRHARVRERMRRASSERPRWFGSAGTLPRSHSPCPTTGPRPTSPSSGAGRVRREVHHA